ncbi:multi-sensor signal transduction histidine kinase [Methanoregula boonei 6A8]|uniref:histidine kinase n=1 Tax=Methanoregula boonei (strain DSM 21154 / JCM 14090 / 6A8) TaxID=456442 RepID=A7I548_METB6|nr:PAS domain S-box protein [Methanoregula boonei]ABS54859.1 multi-sensor signal transduction histidine kinase [Methanoregula boonei 6A8]
MYTVLYVDDEPDLLEISKLFLEQSGQFSVDILPSAPEALAAMKVKTYDAIVSDYQMPGMDGIDFLKNVRALGDTIPFILFTGRGREEVVIQALNEGADFYLQKGGDPTAQFAELTHKVLLAIEHRSNAEKIQSLNRLYLVISAIDRAIVQLRTKSEFLSEVCRILVETGGFRMAWIGIPDPGEGIIRPVASAGQVEGYLEIVRVALDDSTRGCGPTGKAYREGKNCICNDIVSDPCMEPWRKEALKRGYNTCAAFPFGRGSNNPGVLVLYASELGFFNDQIISLTNDLVADIAFALATLDHQKERESAIAALRESEEKYRLVVEDSRDAIYIHQSDRLLFVNRQASVLTGYSHEELLTIRLWDLVHPDDREILIRNNRDRLAGNPPPHEFTARLLTKDGTSRTCEFVVDMVMYQGSPAIMGIARDITERRKTEEALASANMKLKLLSGITRHDIRNQLTILEGRLAFMKKKEPDSPFLEHFEKMSAAARRIASIIQFTKEYEDIGIRAPAWQDCRTLVDTAAQQVHSGQVPVKNDLPPGTEVFADPLIVRVFYNLMDNAARYGGKITFIRFSLEGSGNDYRIVCEDDGEGIPAEDKEKIFLQGFGKNTGLGLFLSAAILHITGITIRETGEPGKGARFEIIVPKGAYRFSGGE